MIRWLKDGQGDYHEQPVHLYDNFDLLVTPTGHVDDIPGSRKVYQLILDDLHAKQRLGTIPELEDGITAAENSVGRHFSGNDSAG